MRFSFLKFFIRLNCQNYKNLQHKFVNILFLFPVGVLYSMFCCGAGYLCRYYRRERMIKQVFHQKSKQKHAEFTAAFNRQHDDAAIYATIRKGKRINATIQERKISLKKTEKITPLWDKGTRTPFPLLKLGIRKEILGIIFSPAGS